MSWGTYPYLFTRLCDFMESYDLFSGCDPFKVCDEIGIECAPYSIGNKSRCLKISNDGFSMVNNRGAFIFYSDAPDKIRSRRVNFTIAHEIGHFILYHHQILRKHMLAQKRNRYYPDQRYAVAEKQADEFAHNLLMPPEKTQLLIDQNYTAREMRAYFDVSGAMYDTRMGHLRRDLKRWRTLCKTCSHCGANRISYLPYCHICGKPYLEDI